MRFITFEAIIAHIEAKASEGEERTSLPASSSNALAQSTFTANCGEVPNPDNCSPGDDPAAAENTLLEEGKGYCVMSRGGPTLDLFILINF
jgi:hypothetical protein